MAGLDVAATALLLTACLNAEWTQAGNALNADRANNGRSALATQNDAQKKAQAWAEKLARDDALSHSKLSDGINVRWCSLGENVGYGAGVAAAERGFMASPPHRNNILGSAWNGVGVGVAHNGNRTYVVQFFIQTC